MASQSEHHERSLHHPQPARPKVWTVDFTTTDFEFPQSDNDLAIGVFCPTCGTRLVGDRGDVHPCPLCGEESA